MLEVVFPTSLLGAISLRKPSNSKRISAGSNPSLALAITNTRFLRWASPKYWASRTRHATVLLCPNTTPAFVHRFPDGLSSLSPPASLARKQPKALSFVLRTPGTFSQKIMAGLSRLLSIASAISQKVNVKFPLASSRDCLLPATLNAWHGVPPQSISGASISPFKIFSGNNVISPRFGTSG